MTAKTATWLFAMGSFVIFIGVCFIPAAFGPDPDRTMLGAGSVFISTGLVFLAGGLYVKARILGAGSSSHAAAPVKRSRKSNCDRCAKEEPVIQCRVHQIHLCGNCLTEHYDFRSCAYVPSTRHVGSKATGAALSQSASS
jgi:hypothetical protein